MTALKLKGADRIALAKIVIKSWVTTEKRLTREHRLKLLRKFGSSDAAVTLQIVKDLLKSDVSYTFLLEQLKYLGQANLTELVCLAIQLCHGLPSVPIKLITDKNCMVKIYFTHVKETAHPAVFD